MNKKTNSLLKGAKTFTILLLIASCNSDDNTPIKEEDFYDNIKGEWEGTYSGGDSGNWNGYISETGNFSGTVYSSTFNITFSLEGQASPTGELEANYTYNNIEVGSFNGNINGETVSGNWTNEQSNIEGTFTGYKK